MIYLAQTDTTAGFLSRDAREINYAKKRAANQPCIITSAYLTSLKILARSPNKHKNRLRRAKKTTFIHKNSLSFRLVFDKSHREFLRDFSYLYSSSANAHGSAFCEDFARTCASVVIGKNFYEASASTIFKINNKSIKKIR